MEYERHENQDITNLLDSDILHRSIFTNHYNH
jgi:hypothetical protein